MSGVPMNMLDWQLQMRAQKEKERKKKTESAEILRGYRGGVSEEDVKLTTLKQEERRKQEEAAAVLRNYRVTHTEDLERTQRHNNNNPQRKIHPDIPLPPVVQKQEDVIEFKEGLVAEKAAQFDIPNQVVRIAPHKQGGVALAPPLPPEKERSTTEECQRLQSDFKLVAAQYDNGPAMEVDVDSGVVVTERAHPVVEEDTPPPALASAHLTREIECPPTFASSSSYNDVPAPVLKLTAQESGDKEIQDNEEEEEDDEEELEEKKVEPQLVLSTTTTTASSDPPLHHHPTVVRLDVNFSFGLITTSKRPILDSYMMAVEEVVKKKLLVAANDNQSSSHHHQHLSQHITYNPSFLPFVQSCEHDDSYVDPAGRANVQRVLVTAAVPVFLSNGISINIARDAIIEALQEAIQSGLFLAIARDDESAIPNAAATAGTTTNNNNTSSSAAINDFFG